MGQSPVSKREPEESAIEPQKDTQTNSPDENDPDSEPTVKNQMNISVSVSETEENASQTKTETPADGQMRSDDTDHQSETNISSYPSGASYITSDYGLETREKFSYKAKTDEPPENKKHPSPAETRGYSGLRNQGAMSHLNAVLQTLFMTQDLRRAVLELKYKKRTNREAISSALQELFRCLESNNGSVSTTGVTKALGIRNVFEEQDAAEYFQKILSEIEPETAKIFQGKKKHSTTCLGSKHPPVEEENPFFSLAITLDSDHCGVISVRKSFTAQFDVMLMDGEDQLFCENCSSLKDMEMKYTISELPQVLTLHLKRFYFDYNYMTYRKNNQPVQIPLQLSAQDESGVPHDYDLYAVVNHTGSLSSGQYYAHIKSFEDQQWYEFNDSWVHRIQNHYDDLISDAACLLFFRKHSSRVQCVQRQWQNQAEDPRQRGEEGTQRAIQQQNPGPRTQKTQKKQDCQQTTPANAQQEDDDPNTVRSTEPESPMLHSMCFLFMFLGGLFLFHCSFCFTSLF